MNKRPATLILAVVLAAQMQGDGVQVQGSYKWDN